MRTLLFLFLCICFISCEKDSNMDFSESWVITRNNESDLDFILRATHPKQEVDYVLPDGSISTMDFHGHINVFSDGKTTGKAHLGSIRLGWRFEPVSARWECDENSLIVFITAEVTPLEDGKKGSKGEATLQLQSQLNDTDSPDCVIWDIDSGGGEFGEGSFDANGNIFIANSQCDDDPR